MDVLLLSTHYCPFSCCYDDKRHEHPVNIELRIRTYASAHRTKATSERREFLTPFAFRTKTTFHMSRNECMTDLLVVSEKVKDASIGEKESGNIERNWYRYIA